MERIEQIVQHLEDTSYLIQLSEIYLKMTPAQSFFYEKNYRIFHVRISGTPFNLDTQGPMPIRREIPADVSAYISERIELYEEEEQKLQRLPEQLDKERAYHIAMKREDELLKAHHRQQLLLTLWEKSYSVLPLEFRQFLLSAIQLDCHEIQMSEGRYHFIEEYWDTSDNNRKKTLVCQIRSQ